MKVSTKGIQGDVAY